MSNHTFRDARINGDRDVVVEAGDIQLTRGIDENVSQSVSINSGNAVRRAIGGQLTADSVERLTDRVSEVLQNDVQIENVVDVEVEEINKVENTIEFRVILLRDTDFTIEVPA